MIGRDGVAAAVPLLQPLALSAGTRRAIARHEGLLTQTRAAAAAVSGREDQELARIRRVRPRTLLAIAAAAGAFYFLLPQLQRWEAAGTPYCRPTGHGCRWSSPCRPPPTWQARSH